MDIGKRILSIVIIISIVVGLSSCGDDESPQVSGFDRSAMLEDMANNLIIPNFESLQTSVNSMEAASAAFIQNTNEVNLLALRNAWTATVIDFQHCSAFGFGPGELNLGPFATVLGVFPVDEAQVEANIINPDFNLSASFDRDIRGFYTIEYLIYGDNQTNAAILESFDDDRKAYLELITSEIKTSIDGIVTQWNTTYFDEFISSDGTSAGSSVSQLYNSFVQDYENIKNFKVELPAGLTAGQTTADPTLVEAYYSGISTQLIEEHFANSINIWTGTSRSGQDIIGFEEYLQTVVGGPELIEATKLAIAEIEEAITNLPAGRLSDHVASSEVVTLRDEFQANTANFKSSMSSLLGISITFVSGDGD